MKKEVRKSIDLLIWTINNEARIFSQLICLCASFILQWTDSLIRITQMQVKKKSCIQMFYSIKGCCLLLFAWCLVKKKRLIQSAVKAYTNSATKINRYHFIFYIFDSKSSRMMDFPIRFRSRGVWKILFVNIKKFLHSNLEA